MRKKVLGVTQVELASAAKDAGWNDCTGQMLSRAERGRWWPQQGDLRALEKAAKVKPGHFFSDEASVSPSPEVEFPCGAPGSVEESRNAVAQIRELLRGWDATKKLGVEVPDPKRAKSIGSVADAEARATALRHFWHLGLAPLPELRELFEEHGLLILDSGITNAGKASRKDPLIARCGHIWVLVLPPNLTGADARRWSLLRGLGMIYGGKKHSPVTDTYFDAFVRAFSAPCEAVRSYLKVENHGTCVGAFAATIAYVQAKFGLPLDAARRHVTDLAKLATSTRQNLVVALRSAETEIAPFELPAWRSWREAVRRARG